MDGNDEYGFCPECRREIGASEWNGECSSCEDKNFPCANKECVHEEKVYIDGDYCLRCEKILLDAEIDSRYYERKEGEEDG